ncbi:MAG: hypothetical protein ACPGU7_01435 [Gammaproteobacteria bacterium]
MAQRPDSSRYFDSIVLLALFAIFLFASPLVEWWSDSERPWFLPYLLWGLVILIAAWIQIRHRDHEL